MSPEDRVRLVAARYDGDDDEVRLLEANALRRLEYRRRRGGKECPRCEETKPVSAFRRHSGKSDGLYAVCRDCERTIRSANREGL